MHVCLFVLTATFVTNSLYEPAVRQVMIMSNVTFEEGTDKAKKEFALILVVVEFFHSFWTFALIS